MQTQLRICWIFPVAVAAVMMFGCERDEPIAAYRAPKEQVAPATNDAVADAHDHDDDRAATPIEWTVPDGWQSLPANEMRFASFAVSSDDPKLAVTVIPLGPNLPKLANINRWEGQIGLPPSDESKMSSLLKQIDVNGVAAETIELSGPKETILAAIFERPDKTWYIKLQGEASKVAQQRERFDAFVKSIRFPAAGATKHVHTMPPMPAAESSQTPTSATTSLPPSHPPLPGAALPGAPPGAALPGAPPGAAPASSAPPAAPQAPAASGALPWTAPADWTLEPERPMRMATYKTPGDAQVIVSSFGQEAFKDKLANINRWRAMIDLPRIDNADAQPVEKTTVGGQPAALYQFANADRKLVIVTVDRGQNILFVRVVGPAAAVDAQQPGVRSFLDSFQW